MLPVMGIRLITKKRKCAVKTCAVAMVWKVDELRFKRSNSRTSALRINYHSMELVTSWLDASWITMTVLHTT